MAPWILPCVPFFPSSIASRSIIRKDQIIGLLKKFMGWTGYLETPIHSAIAQVHGTASSCIFLQESFCSPSPPSPRPARREICTARAACDSPCVFDRWLSHVLTSPDFDIVDVALSLIRVLYLSPSQSHQPNATSPLSLSCMLSNSKFSNQVFTTVGEMIVQNLRSSRFVD